MVCYTDLSFIKNKFEGKYFDAKLAQYKQLRKLIQKKPSKKTIVKKKLSSKKVVNIKDTSLEDIEDNRRRKGLARDQKLNKIKVFNFNFLFS